VDRIVDRNPVHGVRQVHSGPHVLVSVQVGGPERGPGFLVMRRSGVRFPKAAQFKRLISLMSSVAVARLCRATNMLRRVRIG
jgi:hypothetical protein